MGPDRKRGHHLSHEFRVQANWDITAQDGWLVRRDRYFGAGVSGTSGWVKVNRKNPGGVQSHVLTSRALAIHLFGHLLAPPRPVTEQ